MSHSALIRDASSCSRWERYRDPQLASVQSVRDLGKLNPKWVVFIKSLPLGVREEEEVESLYDAYRMVDTEGNCFQTQQDLCIQEPQRLWQHAQDLNISRSEEFQYCVGK